MRRAVAFSHLEVVWRQLLTRPLRWDALTAEPAPAEFASPGEPYPLGATFDGLGTNFSIFSQVADSVKLCLFDSDGTESRYPL
ncbi:MAG: hypothetical protein JO337_13080, partial [Acidimicrobiales bacterium]|nr:hypothetical protein [Acidimicrobiales bacterium]